jgi:hypothetical protein
MVNRGSIPDKSLGICHVQSDPKANSVSQPIKYYGYYSGNKDNCNAWPSAKINLLLYLTQQKLNAPCYTYNNKTFNIKTFK